MIVTAQIYRINLILIDEVQRFQFKIFKLGFVTCRFVEVENALFVWLSTELFDRCGSGEVFNGVVHKVVDDILYFELGGVFEHSVDLLELQGLDIISVDLGCAVYVVFSANNKSILEF